jgi:DNA-binding transcriptional LysR family regulator
MDLKDLNAFVAVAEAYGFRRAASHLGIEQSALSRRIRGLEDQLGVSLFERHRGGVRLTVAGRRFLKDVRIVFSHLEAAIRTVRAAGQAGEGTLKVGIVASISSSFLNSLLRTFRAAHPTVSIELIEGEPRAHIADVVGRELDLAFLTGTPQPQGCDAEQLWHEPILAALPADDPRAGAGILQLSDMTEDLFIVSRAAPGPEIHDYIVQRLATLGSSPRIDHHRVAREGLMAMVGLGFGVSLVSGAEAGVSYPHVAFVPLAGEVLPFSAVWSPDNDNPALRRLLTAARVQARKANAASPSRTRDRLP